MSIRFLLLNKFIDTDDYDNCEYDYENTEYLGYIKHEDYHIYYDFLMSIKINKMTIFVKDNEYNIEDVIYDAGISGLESINVYLSEAW